VADRQADTLIMTDMDNYNYHYKREERLAMLPERMQAEKEKKTFFKRNPGLLIIFLDIILITLIYAVLAPLAWRNQRTAQLSSYVFTASSFVHENKIYFTINAENKKGKPEKSNILKISFLDGAAAVLEKEEILPLNVGQKTVFYDVLPWNPESKYSAVLELAGKKASLKPGPGK
jgi:hypothetical protein